MSERCAPSSLCFDLGPAADEPSAAPLMRTVVSGYAYVRVSRTGRATARPSQSCAGTTGNLKFYAPEAVKAAAEVGYI
jgi:hypothetical protein